MTVNTGKGVKLMIYVVMSLTRSIVLLSYCLTLGRTYVK